MSKTVYLDPTEKRSLEWLPTDLRERIADLAVSSDIELWCVGSEGEAVGFTTVGVSFILRQVASPAFWIFSEACPRCGTESRSLDPTLGECLECYHRWPIPADATAHLHFERGLHVEVGPKLLSAIEPRLFPLTGPLMATLLAQQIRDTVSTVGRYRLEQYCEENDCHFFRGWEHDG